MSVVLETPLGFDARVRYEIRVARKAYRCDDYPASDARVIKPGDRYILCTEFPGGESGYADAAGHPVRMRICRECAPMWTRESFPESTDSGAVPVTEEGGKR